MTAARQVKQHCINIPNRDTRIGRGPLSSGVPTNAVSSLDLEETDGGSSLITSGVKVNVFPPVIRAPVEHDSNESLIAKQCIQVQSLFNFSSAFRVYQELVNQ
jgi:hypothetical protein